MSSINLKMVAEAILYSSIQFAIGSVEMSSRFSVKNFSKDQETLQNAADALFDYMKIGTLWTVGVAILLYCKYKWAGVAGGVIANGLIIMWTYLKYLTAFRFAAKKYNLQMPQVIRFNAV
jgi:hypothetical protein